MSRGLQLSEETVILRLNSLSWEFWLNSWVKVNTTSRELAESFGKEVLLKPFDWEKNEKEILNRQQN